MSPHTSTSQKIRPHLHKYLRIRLGIYLGISASVGAFVVYNAVRNTIPGIFAVVGVVIGLAIGFAASRIHKISWDEKVSKAIARVDAFGVVVLILYILFEIFREKIVGRFVDEADVTVTSFSILAGMMYGRVLGIRGNVVRVLEKRDIL